ncbi:MAG: glycosyltransferase [Cytophagales bacterium]|nr:glycosyltransferase [Cytophagales bacterium]
MKHIFCVLAYKESPYLDECITSLLSQKLKSEIIICTSTPNAHINSVASKYHIHVIVNEHKGGIASDWNFAIQSAKSDYVTLVHQDDIYSDKYTTELAKMMDSNTIIFFTNYGEIVNNKKIKFSPLLLIKRAMLFLPYYFSKVVSTYFYKSLPLKLGNPICCPSVTYNLNKMPNFRFQEKYKFVLDWHGWYMLSKYKGTFCYSSKILVYHRIHDGSETTKSIKDNFRANEELEMFTLIWGRFIANLIMNLYKFGHLLNKR